MDIEDTAEGSTSGAVSATVDTSSALTPAGSDQATIAFLNGSDVTPTAAAYVAGSAIDAFVSSAYTQDFFGFVVARFRIFIEQLAEAAAVRGTFDSSPNSGAIAALSLSGVAGFGTEQVSDDVDASASPFSVASPEFTGLEPGQPVLGALFIFDFANNVTSVAFTGDTVAVGPGISAGRAEERQVYIYPCVTYADGDGNATLSGDVSYTGTGATIPRMWGIPIIEAEGGGGFQVAWVSGGVNSVHGG